METPLDKIPERIKHYLLDFKDQHYNIFVSWYYKVALRDLTLAELADMLEKVANWDMIEVQKL